jgi:hypothetical protein
MNLSFEDIGLVERLLKSKHLVVVLGMKNVGFMQQLFLTPLKGAGVSKAAGIQSFRGTEGLLSVSSSKGSVLELFEKDTFQVGGQLEMLLPF